MRQTLAIHRDRGTNGNEIGENITIIKRKPRHGLYITGACLIKWVRRSYKKKNTRSRAEHWLGAVARRDRNLFAHWKFGILPSVGEGAV